MSGDSILSRLRRPMYPHPHRSRQNHRRNHLNHLILWAARTATLSPSFAALTETPASAITRRIKYAVTVRYIAGRSMSAVKMVRMNGNAKSINVKIVTSRPMDVTTGVSRKIAKNVFHYWVIHLPAMNAAGTVLSVAYLVTVRNVVAEDVVNQINTVVET
jgi:hypothetical protein